MRDKIVSKILDFEELLYVGTDLKPGEYVAFPWFNYKGSVSISKNGSKSKESEILSRDFESNTVFVVHEGEYIRIKNAFLVEVKSQAEVTDQGMILCVGEDIPEGLYTVIPLDETGYIYIANSAEALQNKEYVLAMHNYQGVIEKVTFKQGQVVCVSKCRLQIQSKSQKKETNLSFEEAMKQSVSMNFVYDTHDEFLHLQANWNSIINRTGAVFKMALQDSDLIEDTSEPYSVIVEFKTFLGRNYVNHLEYKEELISYMKMITGEDWSVVMRVRGEY